MLTFRRFLGSLKLDANLVEDLKNLLENFSIRYTMFMKFEEIWSDKVKMQDRYPLNQDTAKRLKDVAWLIFVIAKSKVSGFLTPTLCIGKLLRTTRNVGDLAFLLCAVLHIVVQYAPTDVICEVYECKS